MTTLATLQNRSYRRLLRPLATAAVIFGSSLLMGPSAHAQVIIDVEADTWVNFGAKDTNYGSNTTMVVANDGGTLGVPKNDDHWAIFRFDVTGLDPGGISGAVLTLQQMSATGTNYTLFAIADLGADESFNELTYTFNTSSYGATTNSGYNSDGGLLKPSLLDLGDFTTTGAGVAEFSSAALDDFLNADTNNIVTFILYQDTQEKTDRTFATRESLTGQAPQLVIIPEPSTGIALCVGLGFLGIFRRRP